jgi:hypothetical protein
MSTECDGQAVRGVAADVGPGRQSLQGSTVERQGRREMGRRVRASSERIADTAGPVGSSRVDAGRGEQGGVIPGSCGGGVLPDILLAVLRNVPKCLDSRLGTLSSTPPVFSGGLTAAYL